MGKRMLAIKKTVKDISPKKENSVIIYSPSSYSRPVWVSSAEEDILKNVDNQTVDGIHW